MLHGNSEEWDVADDQPMPRLSVTPPTNAPITSWAPDEVEAITIAFFPDAWRQLGGDPASDAIPEVLQEAMNNVWESGDLEHAWQLTCEMLAAVWIENRTGRETLIRDLSDWARSIIARAATTGRGRSLRSFGRHLKHLAGHSQRTLSFHTAFENLHRVWVTSGTDASLASIAQEAGYSDQSHMGRAVRRATGFSPAQLDRAIKTQEAFWCYRLLGERL